MSKPRYPLQDLIMVREFRETAASRTVSLVRKKLELAREAVLEAKRTCDEYRVWRVEEEKRSFEKILLQEISLEKLEEQKQEVRSLREKEADYEQAVFDAEKHVDECQVELREAIEAHLTAQRDLSKLEEHREVWKSEQALVLERKEEDEMDDFRVAPPLNIS